MPLILTEEQTMLKEAADGFLNENAPIAHLRPARQPRRRRRVARAVEGVRRDGVRRGDHPRGTRRIGPRRGRGRRVAEALGRTLTPSPFMGSGVLSAKMLTDGGSADQQAAWLPKIAAGEAILSLAVDEGAKHGRRTSPRPPNARATASS
jgi:alkylation response protein AidB-like acyl-CoA dehydrogenase